MGLLRSMKDSVTEGLVGISATFFWLVFGFLSTGQTVKGYIDSLPPLLRDTIKVLIPCVIAVMWFRILRRGWIRKLITPKLESACVEFNAEKSQGIMTLRLRLMHSGQLTDKWLVGYAKVRLRLRPCMAELAWEKPKPEFVVDKNGDVCFNSEVRLGIPECDCIRNSETYPNLELELCQVDTNNGSFMGKDPVRIAILPGKVIPPAHDDLLLPLRSQTLFTPP